MEESTSSAAPLLNLLQSLINKTLDAKPAQFALSVPMAGEITLNVTSIALHPDLVEIRLAINSKNPMVPKEDKLKLKIEQGDAEQTSLSFDSPALNGLGMLVGPETVGRLLVEGIQKKLGDSVSQSGRLIVFNHAPLIDRLLTRTATA
ncbi:MAG: hypothetical protein OEZ59_04185 [Deltaproteobacteria bacterium]|nr:hypothetical protein [Deltaproteobacteria bacterium]